MARYKTAEARRMAIERLAAEVCYHALNYYPPNSPATVFLLILSAFAPMPAMEPAEIGVPEAGTLGWQELELLKKWLTKMWKVCETPEDIQYLYDLVYECPEWLHERYA